MKILQVIHDFLPRHTAGSEVYTYKLSKELVKRGHEVSLFFTEAERGARQYTMRQGIYDGLPYFEAIVNRDYKDFTETYDNPEMDRLFAEVLEQTNPDIIHLQHLINHSMGYIDIAKKRSIPVVFTLHDYWLSCPLGGQRLTPDFSICHEIEHARCGRCVSRYSKNSFVLRKLFKKISRRGPAQAAKSSPGAGLAAKSFLKVNGLFESLTSKALIPAVQKREERILKATENVDLFISPSLFLKERFAEFGIPEEKILYSDNGFDVSAFAGKKTPPKKEKKIRFGYTGSIVPHKGVHVLVEAFSGLGKEYNDKAELKIYGNLTWFPDYTARLRAAVKGSEVRFMGAFEHKDISKVLSGIDVLVVPSIWFENSPLTIHEAFISGLPVITSNLGGMAELVRDGVSGFVFTTGEAASLREKMEMIIRDEKLLDRLIKGLPKVKTIADDADSMEKRYMRLISCKSPARAAMVRG
ncbi:MAG: glycosyltransferase family 4 protein [Thermodesulfobacteriota bacterium]